MSTGATSSDPVNANWIGTDKTLVMTDAYPNVTTGPIPAVADQSAARHRLRPDPAGGGPGTTRIEDSVVEKAGAYIVSQVDGVGGAANRILGVAVGSDTAERRPKISARVDGQSVALQVRLSVNYPTPVGQTTDAVRARLADTLGQLTGLAVQQVDITVAALHAPRPTSRELS